MKKYLLLAFFGVCSFFGFSQNVGIGTSNPLNKLHIAGGLRIDTLANGTDSGLLRHDKNGVVYGLKFTGNSTDVLRGDGTFGATSTPVAAWLLNGNAGTSPATNFIGTTDAQPLYFKVNNSVAGRIDLASNNTAFGLGAIPLTSTGVTNTAFGFDALSSNTTGYANTAQGHSSLIGNTTGNQNTALGYGALLRNTEGNQNTAVGVTSLYGNFTGSNNTAIGFGADILTDGLTNATAIGFNAKAGQSNSIVLGQGANIGIGTSYPNTTSLLDLTSNSKGILIPRMTSSERNAIFSPAIGLLVYDSSLNSFYYHNGTSWAAIGGGSTSSNGWLLTGNAGTDSATQFIGTLDAKPILFRVNNIAAGQIHLVNRTTSFGVGTLINNTGNLNTALGHQVLYSNTTGYDNTGTGEDALYSNTTGHGNTAFGQEALYSNTTGYFNTANGEESLWSNTTGINNTGYGNATLFATTTGNDNTGTGSGALLWNTTGNDNTSTGSLALVQNTTGNSNTATGSHALYNNTTANANTAIGYYSLTTNTTGSYNTGTGYNSLKSNTTGYANTANGYQSLYSNTTGHFNTAVGNGALYYNTSGFENTATGDQALNANSTGNNNTAYGASALHFNTTGGGNTANGLSALYSNTTGIANTADGTDALYNNTTGQSNTSIGYSSLANTTQSWYNTAIGYNAGDTYDNGYNNVFVGANTDVNGADYYNVIAIGQGTICTDVSQVTIGNSATTAYRAYAGWSNISDGRYKKDVKENIPGLAFINKLRPVSYTVDATALDYFLHKNQTGQKQMNDKSREMMNRALRQKEQIRYTGFIAQDVEKSAKELGFNFSGIDAPKNEHDVYGLRYSEFVVPLVKAVQEQQAIIENQNKKIDAQQQQITQQQKQIDELINDVKALKGKSRL